MASVDHRYWTTDWRRLRLFVLDRDHWTCQVRDVGCTHAGTAVDHIVPAVNGGDFWSPSNLRAICRHCNSIRGARLVRARQARYRNSVATYDSRF